MHVEYDFKDDVDELKTYARKISNYCNERDCVCLGDVCTFYSKKNHVCVLLSHSPFTWNKIVTMMEESK